MSVADEAVVTAWHTETPEQTAELLGTDLERGLGATEAADRLARYGANQLKEETKASVWEVALGQLRDPMNIMLVVVAIASLIIGQVSTAFVVLLLVLLNLALGTRQELAARASVDALAQMQVPEARVIRDGSLVAIPAIEVVPGDLLAVESGDIVAADGRLIRAANLETQEAALTGESAPIPKDADVVDGDDTPLGDRTDMVFQNTSVTRGTGSVIVTTTGMETEVGKIAGLLQSVDRTKSPLQQQLDGLTKWLGVVAWTALAIVVAIGAARGLPLEDLLLLGVAVAISAIPTGMPTFVQGMLSFGARRLADSKAIVRNLTDVETLGSTSAINTDKTGTLTMNQMTATKLLFAGDWYTIEGGGYGKTGAVQSAAGGGVTGLRPALARPDAGLRRHGVRRRPGHRRPDRGGPRRVGRQARRRRRADPRQVPAPGRGAVRLGLQVHGHLPALRRRVGRGAGRNRQGRPRRGPRPEQQGALARRGGADRDGPPGAPRRQPVPVRERAAGARTGHPADPRRRVVGGPGRPG